MKRLVAATILSALAGQASALSCLRPDVARAFNRASEAEETYVVLFGEFDFRPPVRNGNSQSPQTVEITAGFAGKALGLNGFEDTTVRSVQVSLECFGPWCGDMSPNVPTVAFAQRVGHSYVVSIDPCYSSVFPKPSAADLQRLTSCMRGEDCEEARLR